MVLKFHGFVFSTNSQRVFQVLKELNIPYEFVNVHLGKGEHKSPEYLAKHPFGVVPFIVCVIAFGYLCQGHF
jgi:glutathione S-transferase